MSYTRTRSKSPVWTPKMLSLIPERLETALKIGGSEKGGVAQAVYALLDLARQDRTLAAKARRLVESRRIDG